MPYDFGTNWLNIVENITKKLIFLSFDLSPATAGETAADWLQSL